MGISDVIGESIKKFREERKMTQNDLAEKMHLTRPGISNWENGKSEPSSSQLVMLAKIFNVTTDEIVGNTLNNKSAVIVDTSALIKRPAIIEELIEKFNEVIIPQIVISELNNIKDNKKNPANAQKAWLILSSIEKVKSNIDIRENISGNGNNDEKIAEIAVERAKKNYIDDVYILSDDIYFQFLTKTQKNLKAITPKEYSKKFHKLDIQYDISKSIEFCSLVKKREIKAVEKLELKGIDINYHDPEDGFTPLIRAVRNKDITMIDFLLNCEEINIDAIDKYKYFFSAIHHATQLKNMEIIKKLSDAGADIDLGSKGKNSGNTPLMISAWSNFIEGVDYFISLKACTNQQDNNGYTPLMKACINNHIESIKKLINITDLSIRSKENKKAEEYLDKENEKSLNIIKLFKEVSND